MKNKKKTTGKFDIFEQSDCFSFDKIIQYKNNMLSKVETYTIEKHLIDCEICSDILDGIISADSDQEILEGIENINTRVEKHIYFLKHRKKKIFQIFAAAAIFLGILIIFKPDFQSRTNELFDYYFKPFPNLIPITRGETPDALISQAMQAYDFHNYGRAEEMLKSIDENDHNQISVFYLGIIYLKSNNINEAQKIFEQTIRSGDRKLFVHAKWYLALSYLRSDDITNLKTTLNEILEEDSIYHKACEDILREFRNHN